MILSHARSLAAYNWPDLNPVDYTVWSALQEWVCRTKISDVDKLKRNIISEWAAPSNTIIDSAVKVRKVVQAHTLSEVGILGTALLRVSSGTSLTIFIEIGSYLTEKEQKNKLAQFFWDTVYIHHRVGQKSKPT